MDTREDYLEHTRQQLLKSIDQLEYSHLKIVHLSPDISTLDNEALETWESYCSRFARVADIFMNKFIKASIKLNDPAFNGTLRDYLNQAEKEHIISEVGHWLRIRELRNTIAHDYSVKDIGTLFKNIQKSAPLLIELRSKLQ